MVRQSGNAMVQTVTQSSRAVAILRQDKYTTAPAK